MEQEEVVRQGEVMDKEQRLTFQAWFTISCGLEPLFVSSITWGQRWLARMVLLHLSECLAKRERW